MKTLGSGHPALSKNQVAPKLLPGHLQLRSSAVLPKVGSASCRCNNNTRPPVGFRPLVPQASASSREAVMAPEKPPSPTPLPTTFKRLVARKVGGSFREVAQVDEAPLELPGEGQVLVQVLYTGINGGCETFRARGESYTPFARNTQAAEFALGAEGAGVVVAVGPGVTTPQVGQHVTTSAANSFAEYVSVIAQSCWLVDEATPEAVAITLSGVTAAVALEVTGGPLRSGEVALVTAAAGGTGHFGVQLAKLAGCHVIATCGGPAKVKALKALGVDRVIDHRSEDVAAVLSKEYPGKINVAYEGVGGELRRAILENMADGGRMLAPGYISGYPHNADFIPPPDEAGEGDLPPDHLLMWKAMTVQHKGKTVFGNVWSGASPDDVRACRARLFDLYREGKLEALVDRTRDFTGLESIPDAMEYMLSGASVGKVVARVTA